MEEKHPRIWKQCLSAMCANMAVFAAGSVTVYSSPAAVQLASPETSDIVLTSSELNWFVSVVNIGAVVGCPIGSFFLPKLGRRGTCLLMGIICLLGWLLIVFARNAWMLIVGRLICSTIAGTCCLVVPAYHAEIASPEIRGKIGSSFFMVFSSGAVFTYIVGIFVKSWRALAAICALIPSVFVICMFFNYETPAYLLMCGKEREAAVVLQKLRGRTFDISLELDSIKRLASRAKQKKTAISLAKLRRSEVWKPFSICLAVVTLNMTTGYSGLSFNLEAILLSTRSSISVDTMILVFGIARVVGGLLGLLLIDRVGRRPSLAGTTAVIGLSLVFFGLYFKLQEYNETWTVEHLFWLPLASLIVYGLMYTAGLGSVPWVLVGELLTPDIVDFCGSVVSATSWFISFLVSISFYPLQEISSIYAVIWMYSGFCFLLVIFTLVWVPETKGRSVEDINLQFRKDYTNAEAQAERSVMYAIEEKVDADEREKLQC